MGQGKLWQLSISEEKYSPPRPPPSLLPTRATPRHWRARDFDLLITQLQLSHEQLTFSDGEQLAANSLSADYQGKDTQTAMGIGYWTL